MVHDSGTGQGQLINGTDHLVIVNNADDHDIILKSDNGSGGTAVYMTLDGSTTDLLLTPPGNVGIGTSSPGQKLHIKDTSGSNALVGLTVENSNGDARFFAQSDYAKIYANSTIVYAGS